MDVPSQYETFENDVMGASSPRTLMRSINNKWCSKSAKKQKVSDVAVAGESPILKDVTSANSSKATPGGNAEARLSQPKNRPLQIEIGDDSTTISFEDLFRPVTSTQAERSKEKHEGTVMLSTQSMLDCTPEEYGQANVLHLPSSPESELDLQDLSKKLPKRVQQARSLRRTREWLDSLPNEPSNDDRDNDDERLDSTLSVNASQNDSGTSVVMVAPHPEVREVQIVLQRLDPQMLLKVPVHDIQNLFTQKPYSLSFPQIQKAMNLLITSAKIGLVPFQQKSPKQIAAGRDTKQKTTNANGEGVSSSFLLRGRKPKKKRKLLTLERQQSNISEVIDMDSHYVTPVECPYSPPPLRTRRPPKKPAPPKAKKTNAVVPKHKNNKANSSAPRKKGITKKAVPPPPENSIRTRSSDLFRKKNNLDMDQNRTPSLESSHDQESFSNQSSIQQGRHEMNSRGKSSRRTSYFFQPKTQAASQTSRKRTPKRKKTFQIVGTFLHRGEMEMVFKTVKKLGGNIQNKVTATTTHVVCGGPKRTINVLRGILRGCWLVKYEWVTQSMRKGHWIDEEPFELTNFSSAVQKCRIAKETLGIYPTIFKNVGSIYIGPQTAPPKAELCELLRLCGGKIVSTTRRASISVGVFVPGCTCVTALWVLDSIQENILCPMKRYSLPSNK